ncbi:MAG TPA: hypothetical protein VLT58_01165 [Polyangia bacterium]|nr:hypothetical protein [Polyangia bacterium]
MRGVASVVGAGVVAVAVFGCAEPEIETQRLASQSAVMNATAGGLLVPAYFSADSGGDTSFAQIAAGHRSTLPEIAVVNAGCDASGNVDPQTGGCVIGGGPGPDRSAYVHDKIAYLRARGIKVFGYVWVGRVTTNGKTEYRNSDDIVADMRAWAQNYADDDNPLTLVNGFFFDSAYRASAGGVAQAEYIAAQAAQYGTWSGPAVGEIGQSAGGRSIFNWGTTAGDYMRPYLDCTLRGTGGATDGWNYVVVQEDAATAFMGTNGELPTWARYQYNPGHFISIVHHASAEAADVSGLLTAARQRWNSAYAYVTDLPSAGNSHTYSTAPSAAVWQAQASQGGTASYVYGAGDDVLTADCPPPNAANPAYP